MRVSARTTTGTETVRTVRDNKKIYLCTPLKCFYRYRIISPCLRWAAVRVKFRQISRGVFPLAKAKSVFLSVF